jgi:hypothetical protein
VEIIKVDGDEMGFIKLYEQKLGELKTGAQSCFNYGGGFVDLETEISLQI